jgi:predicted nuclease with TOPRIM domain
MMSYKQTPEAAGVIRLGSIEVKKVTVARAGYALALIAVIVFAFISQAEGYKRHIRYLQDENEKLKNENEQIKHREKEAGNDLTKIRSEFSPVRYALANVTEGTEKLRIELEKFNDDLALWEDVLPQVQLALEELETRTGDLEKTVTQFGGKLDETERQKIEAARKNAVPSQSTKLHAELKPIPDEKSITVYVTNTGEKYHRAGCGYLRRSSNPMTLKNAQASGYTACSRCW